MLPMPHVQKSISLPPELEDYVQKENLNLSGFVQQKLRQHKEKQRMLKEAELEQRVNDDA